MYQGTDRISCYTETDQIKNGKFFCPGSDMYHKSPKHNTDTECNGTTTSKHPYSSLYAYPKRRSKNRNIPDPGSGMVSVSCCYDNFHSPGSLKRKNTVHDPVLIRFFVRIPHFPGQFSIDIDPVCGKNLRQRNSPDFFLFRQDQNHPVCPTFIRRSLFIPRFHFITFSDRNITTVISWILFQHLRCKKLPRKILPFPGKIMQFCRCAFFIQTEDSLNGLLAFCCIFIIHEIHHKKSSHR